MLSNGMPGIKPKSVKAKRVHDHLNPYPFFALPKSNTL